ncbi:MAG: translocation/assembly module TamB [Alphaproteobacteria bacterium]|nr:translocation/assembly module TamB [Alphaproteobacteria bacterium]
MEEDPKQGDEPLIRRRRRWRTRIIRIALGLVAGLIVLLAALIASLDTGPGHRFLVDRIAEISPASGLKIRIGRIEGSIWGSTRLRDVRVYDPQGLFAESSLIELDWHPTAWLGNRLAIDELTSELVIVHRLPKLRPSTKPGPILPSFDIKIGRLEIAQLRFEKGVTGERRIARLAGDADVRSGRAIVHLSASVRGGERLALALDAEPDRKKFDLGVRLDAPANSVSGTMAGTKRPIKLVVQGDGDWSAWTGSAALDLSGRPAARLALRARQGRYSLAGRLAPAQFLTGKGARLTSPRIDVAAAATLADRRLDGRLSLRSPSLKVESAGVIDLATSSFDGVRTGIDLLRPPALFTNMTGRTVRLTMLLNGPFGQANFAYRLTSPHVAFDATGFDDLRAEGSGRLSRAPLSVPIRLSARRVTGIGAVAGGILANLSVRGVLKVTPQRLSGEGLALSSDKLKGKVSLLVDLRTGRYDIVLSGGMTRYLIPGLGIIDVTTELKVVPAPGRGTLVTGRGRAWVRRFDNKFLAGLAGGLPQIDTGLVRGADGVIHFQNLRLTGPAIRITGNGYRRRDGSFHFEGSGVQRQYGPLALMLDGRIDRPRLEIRLKRPMDGLGLADVLLNLDPTAQGFAYRAAGRSTLGPFTSHGAILLPRAGPAVIEVAALNVSSTNATGSLRSDPGGFLGRLDVAGGGLDGRLLFSPLRGMQRIEAHMTAQDAKFAGPPPISIRRGQLDAIALLDPNGTSIDATVGVRGVSSGALSLANLDATVKLRGGSGQVRATLAGARGRAFSFTAAADVAPGSIRLSGSGTVDGRPIIFTQPAQFTREGDGWRLAPTALRFAGGTANVSGLFGSGRTEIGARVEAMPLTVFDIAYPQLGLGGIASGTFNYRAASGAAPPVGDVNLRIRGLTRAGLVLASKPVDVGLIAKLDGVNAAMRAVAVSEGKTIGRAQARISPIGGGGGLLERVSRAPLFAQLRYNGPADTLWRLTGIELIDISGPVAVGADARGTLHDPVIRGSLQTEKARLESPVIGTVIENFKSSGRFGGSRLVLDSFSGTTKHGGTVAGRGSFDLASARGFGIDLAVEAEAAQLIDRDDLKAQVTGPIAIKSDGSGGTISGDVRLVTGSFRLGAATAAAQVPRLDIREINRPDDEPLPPQPGAPWRLDFNVSARNRLRVTGLGINSEWGAALKINGTVAEPRITGSATLVRGTYDFAGRRFDLDRGTIRFVGESPPNPILDITAEGGVQGVNATIHVTGRGQRPEISFTSTPAMPQDELLSRLLFGTSITNLSAPEAVQLAAAVAALNNTGGGLDPINAVRGAIGLDRLRILPADIATGQGTSIAAGKYIGRRVYVEVITDTRGYSATRLEYQITRWLSILSTISTIGRQSVNARISKDY